MVTLRLVSARMVDLQRSDAIGFHAACIGDEAVIAAAAIGARPRDWVFPGLREWGAAIVRGLPIATYVHHAFGTGRDPAKGHAAPDHPPAREFNVAPASGVPGAHVVQAVGVAWAAKIKKDDVAAIAIFGDAANASGDLHNAMNFAGVFKVPCVFVCRHDGRGPSLKGERAIAFGLASTRVDGSDALAVLAVVRAALARAAAGKGATLIEATTKPLVPAIDSQLLALGDDDPIARLRATLVRERILDGAAQDLVAAGARATLDGAVAEAAAAPRPARSTIFDDVYSRVPAHLEEQKAERESLTWPR
jgi:TPP-dependent pyruvate/acetoin dehydrogenase alpha subunit